jgi:hypothetical protein
MIKILRVLLLLIHIIVSGIGIYYVGDFIFEDLNIAIVIGLIMADIFIIIPMVYHIKIILEYLKKRKQ